MGAAVIALAEVRERKQRAEYRQQLHACFDQWLDTLESHMTDPKPTLEELTRAVWECRQELTGQLTATLLEQHFAAEQGQRQAPCPRGGRVVEARGGPGRAGGTVGGCGGGPCTRRCGTRTLPPRRGSGARPPRGVWGGWGRGGWGAAP